MNQEYNTVGKRIAYLRKEKGYTQEQLAELLNISPQAVSKWENEVSSPDISLIPRIADILGVTTDELLGVKPIEPHVVVVDTGSGKKSADGRYEFQFKGGKWSTIVFGIFLLAIGVLFLLQEFGAVSLLHGISFWSIAWPILLVGLGVSMLRETWFPVAVGCILVGVYKLLYLFAVIPAAYPLTWGMIWPLALLLVGLSCVTSGLFKKRGGKRYHKYDGDSDRKARVVETNDSGDVRVECAFTETRYLFDGDEFLRAHIENSFGSTTFDLRQCKRFADDATIYADVNFGSLNILLPPTIALNKRVDNVFAACTIKGAPNADAPFRLTLSGDVNFGSIEVRY